MAIPLVNIQEFDYNLPNDRIAKYPLANRANSKLLTSIKGEIGQDKFYNIFKYVPENSLMVFNNTKVIQARLFFTKQTGAKIEILCLEPYEPSEYIQVFNETRKVQWKCIVGNLKKWKDGQLSQPFSYNGQRFKLSVNKIKIQDGEVIIDFEWTGGMSFSDVLESIGVTPIPPYLNRESEEIDTKRYQTVYSRNKGSVAAPTAGLHFTDNVLEKTSEHRIKKEYITLHVGAGTFKPVKSNVASEHDMHTEHFVVKKETVKQLMDYHDRIFSVGTTTLRTLESLYWFGVKIRNNEKPDQGIFHLSQWESFELPQNVSLEQSLTSLLSFMEISKMEEFHAATQIMILPGYSFRVIKGLVTNFHQPKSTLLLLIAALVKDHWKEIYEYAILSDFRFLSYGDSSIIIP